MGFVLSTTEQKVNPDVEVVLRWLIRGRMSPPGPLGASGDQKGAGREKSAEGYRHNVARNVCIPNEQNCWCDCSC